MTAMTVSSRRRILRGTTGGLAAAVALPFLDCFLDTNGTARADGTPLPLRFGTWFQGLGFLPGFWEPKQRGAGYELPDQFAALAPYKKYTNIYSGLTVHLDGRPSVPHVTGAIAATLGAVPNGMDARPPSLDSLIADAIGKGTRFRSVDVSCCGKPVSYSRRGGAVVNPAEISPAALYARLFGAGFTDPNAAVFTPDPKVMTKRSVLAVVAEERQAFMRELGAADRARMEEYFTSVRQFERQLQLQLEKPAPRPACAVTAIAGEAAPGLIIDDALTNNRLFSQLLAWALACDQTRVFNLVLSEGNSALRRAGQPQTFHIYTHSESDDLEKNYPINVKWFMDRVVDAMADTLGALHAIREGDGTLLDRTVVYYATDSGDARAHTLDNLPIMTFGAAGGRLKTGVHIAAKDDPVTRVGLTLQQALGVPAKSWGQASNETARPFTDVVNA